MFHWWHSTSQRAVAGSWCDHWGHSVEATVDLTRWMEAPSVPGQLKPSRSASWLGPASQALPLQEVDNSWISESGVGNPPIHTQISRYWYQSLKTMFNPCVTHYRRNASRLLEIALSHQNACVCVCVCVSVCVCVCAQSLLCPCVSPLIMHDHTCSCDSADHGTYHW